MAQYPDLEFMKKWVLSIMDERWTQIVNKREENDHWTVTAPFTDIFTMVTQTHISPENPNHATSGEGRILCTIPKVKCFWDATICLYLAACPKFYGSHASVCKAILHGIETVKINPLSYINFHDDILIYLLSSANGEVQNSFLQNPAECVCEM